MTSSAAASGAAAGPRPGSGRRRAKLPANVKVGAEFTKTYKGKDFTLRVLDHPERKGEMVFKVGHQTFDTVRAAANSIACSTIP